MKNPDGQWLVGIFFCFKEAVIVLWQPYNGYFSPRAFK
jgi:hypothetical protein